MSGAAAVPIRLRQNEYAEVVVLTPEMARALLERNKSNRRFRDYHARRIMLLIQGGRWRFNGDTIKLDREGNLQDGQHRLWAIAEGGVAVKLVIVYGVERAAFGTIDTMRLTRTFGDVIDLRAPDGAETSKYGAQIGGALAWLIRYENNAIADMNLPTNKVENDMIDLYAEEHGGIYACVERTMRLRTIVSPSILGFFIYVLERAGRRDLADRMITTFEKPETVGALDPYMKLYQWFVNARGGGGRAARPKRISGPMAIALMIKATNVAARGAQIPANLSWGQHGSARSKPEQFPRLEISK